MPNIPYYAVVVIAAFSALLSIIGSLGSLVDAASIIFLFTFGVVNWIAYDQKVKYHFISLAGAILSGTAIIGSIYEQLQRSPIPVIVLIVIIILLFVFRPVII